MNFTASTGNCYTYICICAKDLSTACTAIVLRPDLVTCASPHQCSLNYVHQQVCIDERDTILQYSGHLYLHCKRAAVLFSVCVCVCVCAHYIYEVWFTIIGRTMWVVDVHVYMCVYVHVLL